MTETKIGDVFHALHSGLTLPAESQPGRTIGDPGRVLYAGEEFTVTEGLLEATRNRLGVSSLDEEEQIRRWGSLKFERGPAPEGTIVGAGDDSYRVREYTRRAGQISDPAVLRELREEYSDVADLIRN